VSLPFETILSELEKIRLLLRSSVSGWGSKFRYQ
jgi:hypothetical protein